VFLPIFLGLILGVFLGGITMWFSEAVIAARQKFICAISNAKDAKWKNCGAKKRCRLCRPQPSSVD